jgi:hypothetical protein
LLKLNQGNQGGGGIGGVLANAVRTATGIVTGAGQGI